MRLYILRHGTTDWNQNKRLQGNSNTQLNDEGRELAKITAKALEDIPFDHIFSSPLDRACETARIVRGKRNVEIITDKRLIEVCFGIDEGVLPEKRSQGCHLFFDNPGEYVPAEGGERIEELLARTADFIDSVLVPLSLKEKNANVLISGHGAMNKALMAHLCNRNKAQFWDGAWMKNCSISVFEIEGSNFKMLEDGKTFY